MEFSVISCIGIALIIFAIYKLHKPSTFQLTNNIDILESKIIEETESVGLGWMKWYIVQVRYKIIDSKNYEIFDSVGIDKRSSWFSNIKDAEAAIKSIRFNSVCYINKNNYPVLMQKFPFHRKRHYLAVLVSGAILLFLSIFMMVALR